MKLPSVFLITLVGEGVIMQIAFFTQKKKTQNTGCYTVMA